jgi:methionine-rich copper-binding protein CopC
VSAERLAPSLPALAAAGLLALALAAAASAHAYLVHSSPASGEVLKTSPGRVTLTYDEQVTISAGALGVYDASGKHVDSGEVTHPAGDTIAVAIPRRLPRGTYTVAWRVTSADTHVVHGAFTFSVGAPAASPRSSKRARPSRRPSRSPSRPSGSSTSCSSSRPAAVRSRWWSCCEMRTRRFAGSSLA